MIMIIERTNTRVTVSWHQMWPKTIIIEPSPRKFMRVLATNFSYEDNIWIQTRVHAVTWFWLFQIARWLRIQLNKGLKIWNSLAYWIIPKRIILIAKIPIHDMFISFLCSSMEISIVDRWWRELKVIRNKFWSFTLHNTDKLIQSTMHEVFMNFNYREEYRVSFSRITTISGKFLE